MSDRTAPQESSPPTKSEFLAMLEARWDQGFFVCVGLDTDFEQIPDSIKQGTSRVDSAIFRFNAGIIDATADQAVAFKPNIAFYEGQGVDGMHALRKTVDHIKINYPHIPIILDAKRGDIGSTNQGYVKAAFDILGVNAVTVHPYLGKEALKPFLDRRDRGILVLARTSNPGAGEFQDLRVSVNSEPDRTEPLYQHIARNVANEWNTNGNCGLVAGATYPEELARIRLVAPALPLLVPGVGAQGGEIDAVVAAAKNAADQGFIINSSRGIIYAYKNVDGISYDEAARAETIRLTQRIRANLS